MYLPEIDPSLIPRDNELHITVEKEKKERKKKQFFFNVKNINYGRNKIQNSFLIVLKFMYFKLICRFDIENKLLKIYTTMENNDIIMYMICYIQDK